VGTASDEHEEAAAPRSPGAPRAKVLAYLIVLTLGVLLADQASKIIVLDRLNPGEYYPLLGDLFGLRLVFNPGAAFSLASGLTWVFTIAAVVVTVVIIAVAPKLRSVAWATGLGLLLGGNVGNLIDRLFRDPSFAQGHVVDFLSYGGLFIGNVADIAIVAGAPLIALLMIRGTGLDGMPAAEAAHTPADTGADAPGSAEEAESAEEASSAEEAGSAQESESAEESSAATPDQPGPSTDDD